MSRSAAGKILERTIRFSAGAVKLEGDLRLPPEAPGIVIFAHGSGSSRHSPRNRHVANVLNESGLATLLFDLLTAAEEAVDFRTAHLRFDIPLLAERLYGAAEWAAQNDETSHLAIGYFGASTGAAAALVAAARHPEHIAAIVSRGGRPDLAGEALADVRAPTLLIVGERDTQVIWMNQEARAQLRTVNQIEIIAGATHLFEEPGALEQVAELARQWFTHYLVNGPQRAVETRTTM